MMTKEPLWCGFGYQSLKVMQITGCLHAAQRLCFLINLEGSHCSVHISVVSCGSWFWKLVTTQKLECFIYICPW
ncbi:unnamed protein product, partial [Vitis vinifera]|uniref:Uncharacterized protein n=1 Tax=Vitis vinifera TaxID=29760 RepID=D7T390_VITVI